MRTYLVNGKIIYPDGIAAGFVRVEDGRIAEIGPGMPAAAEGRMYDLEGRYLSLGFVEMHAHGAGGADFMDGTEEAIYTAARMHLSHGTTTLYPTALSSSGEELKGLMDTFRAVREKMQNGPELPGLHLEGPYLNSAQKGAMNEAYIRNPVSGEYEELLEYGRGYIARWTLAPELPGAMEFVRALRRERILPSMGHSNAEYIQVVWAFRNGIRHVTHLYSAMSGMERRGGFRFPGLLESAFCIRDLTVEIIADGCHLPVEMLRLVYKAKGADQTALVCDSMRFAGQNVRESFLGSRQSGIPVIIEDGVAKLADRSAFAGSIATDDRMVQVMYKEAGIPLEDCIKMMTLTPARIMGCSDWVGSIAPGKDANLVCFDEDIQIAGVMFKGKVVCGTMGRRMDEG